MDQNDPSQRRYAPNPYSTEQQPLPQANTQAPAQYAMPSAAERFRQSSYLQQSPTSAPRISTVGSEVQQMYAFGQNTPYIPSPQMSTNAIQYSQGTQQPDPQSQQQAQQYTQHGSSFMYGMPQTRRQQVTQTPYEQVPQYKPPGTGSETVATQYGLPRTAQYYLAGQGGPASAPAPELTRHQIHTQYQQATHPQPARSPSYSYPSTMIESSQSVPHQPYGQQPQYTTQQLAVPTTDQASNRYEMQIRAIFTSARDSSLRDVPARLLEASHYLLGSAPALGLTRDDEELHDDRIRLWDEFNNAWLVSLQRQFDMSQEMIQTGQNPPEPQSIMDAQELEHLSRELVRLCDSVETHGLVDYQMGVAEEQIMDLLLRCLALLNPSSPRLREARSQAESSAAGAAMTR